MNDLEVKTPADQTNDHGFKSHQNLLATPVIDMQKMTSRSGCHLRKVKWSFNSFDCSVFIHSFIHSFVPHWVDTLFLFFPHWFEPVSCFVRFAFFPLSVSLLRQVLSTHPLRLWHVLSTHHPKLWHVLSTPHPRLWHALSTHYPKLRHVLTTLPISWILSCVNTSFLRAGC